MMPPDLNAGESATPRSISKIFANGVRPIQNIVESVFVSGPKKIPIRLLQRIKNFVSVILSTEKIGTQPIAKDIQLGGKSGIAKIDHSDMPQRGNGQRTIEKECDF